MSPLPEVLKALKKEELCLDGAAADEMATAFKIDARKDRRGNLEGIPGFNLAWNDPPSEPPPVDNTPKMPPPPPAPPAPPPYFQGVQQRVDARHAGKLKHDTVIKNAKARRDNKALRASDGAPLKLPYRVVLKSARPIAAGF